MMARLMAVHRVGFRRPAGRRHERRVEHPVGQREIDQDCRAHRVDHGSGERERNVPSKVSLGDGEAEPADGEGDENVDQAGVQQPGGEDADRLTGGVALVLTVGESGRTW